MSYSIKVFIYQIDTEGAYFRVVEKTVWNYANGETWDEVNGYHLLKMGGSGTSGSFRLQSNTDESFVITLGIDGYEPWGDIVTDLTSCQTACVTTPLYYNSADADKEKKRTSHMHKGEIYNSKGRVCKL